MPSSSVQSGGAVFPPGERERSRSAQGPFHHSIEGVQSCSIQDSPWRSNPRVRERATPAQHFLADGHPDTLLELEAHERDVVVEDVGRLLDLSRAEACDNLYENRWVRKARH